MNCRQTGNCRGTIVYCRPMKRAVVLLGALSVSLAFFFGLFFVPLNPSPTFEVILWVVMLPGLMGAAILFPAGEHSDYGEAYLYLSLAINSVVYAFPLRWMLEYIRRRWKQRSHAPSFPPAHH